MAIDMHSHYYGGLVDGLAKRSVRPTITTNADGRNVLNAMTASTVMSCGYTDLEARLAYMDAAGIATQLLTFPGALGVDVMPIEEALAIVRDYNDNLANICRGSGGRFAGLAGLPLADIARSCDEMKRVRHSLGLLGVILPGNYFLSVETAERLRPILAAANEQGALVMIHPGLMPGENPPDPYRDHSILRASALNLQASLSHMALTIIVAGFLDDYPNVTFQVVNLGGTLPFILERMDAVAATRPLPVEVKAEDLRRLVYDCASLGPRALELAVKVLGADRIMLGTDYPIFAPNAVRDAIEAAELSENDKRSVLSGTARAIIRRYS